MGGALLQAPQRDDFGWAMKASAAKINGAWVDVFKDPITAKNKTSRRGRVSLFKDSLGYYTDVLEEFNMDDARDDVYLNGKLLRDMTFDAVRANAAKTL
jgi:nicotinamide phosphoribosyltransferase